MPPVRCDGSGIRRVLGGGERGAVSFLGLWVGIIVCFCGCGCSSCLPVCRHPFRLPLGDRLKIRTFSSFSLCSPPPAPRLDDSGNCCKMDGIFKLLSNRQISE